MELNEFIENFADIFDDVDASTLTADTKFRDIDEWSSLAALGVLAMADEEFDVQLKADDMRAANTIGDLYEIIKSKA